MVTAPEKCLSGTCIVAVLEIDTAIGACAHRIASLAGNTAHTRDRCTKGDLLPSQHASRL